MARRPHNLAGGQRRVSRAGSASAQSCLGKTVYPTEAAALRVLIDFSRRVADHALDTFRCRHCGNWHIGHPPGMTHRRVDARERRRWVEQQRLREREKDHG